MSELIALQVSETQKFTYNYQIISRVGKDPPPLSEYATGVSSLEYCLTNLSFYATQHCEYLHAEHEYALCCLTSLCRTHWRWWKSSYGAGPGSWRWSCFLACRYFGLSDCFVCLKPASWVLWFAVATLA